MLIEDIINKYANSKITAKEVITCNGKYPTNIVELKQADNETLQNLDLLLSKANLLRQTINRPIIINSGYRSISHNKKVGGATKSNHTKCLAIDIRDNERFFDKWFLSNEGIAFLKETNTAIEHPRYTNTWAHFQVILPKSQKNIFTPYTREPLPNEHDPYFDDIV